MKINARSLRIDIPNFVIAIREWGVKGTLKRLKFSYFRHRFLLWKTEVADAFDLKNGTETNQKVRTSTYDLPSHITEGAVMYWATPQQSFNEIFSAIEIDFAKYKFIDLGCGKGRVLMLGASLPFKEIIGIDINSSLIKTAKNNVSIYLKEHNLSIPISFHCGPAQEYPLGNEDSIIYLFNPFNAAILKKILQKLIKTLKATHADVLIVFLDPEATHITIMNEFNEFQQIHVYDPSPHTPNFGSFPWRIYRISH